MGVYGSAIFTLIGLVVLYEYNKTLAFYLALLIFIGLLIFRSADIKEIFTAPVYPSNMQYLRPSH